MFGVNVALLPQRRYSPNHEAHRWECDDMDMRDSKRCWGVVNINGIMSTCGY